MSKPRIEIRTKLHDSIGPAQTRGQWVTEASIKVGPRNVVKAATALEAKIKDNAVCYGRLGAETAAVLGTSAGEAIRINDILLDLLESRRHGYVCGLRPMDVDTAEKIEAEFERRRALNGELSALSADFHVHFG